MPKRRANGEGSIYPQTKDTNGRPTLWAAQYTDNAGKKRTLYGKKQQIVRDKLKEAIKQSDKGLLMDKNKITLAEWLVEWLVEWLEVYTKPVCRKGTYINYHDLVYKHIIPAFPKVPLKDLRADMLQKFFNDKLTGGRLVNKEGGLTIGVLKRMKISLSTALEQAVDNDLISFNAATKVKLPKSAGKEIRVLSADEQRKLEKTILNDYNPLSFGILLILYTGLRASELIGLKLTDINFEKNELYIRRTRNRIGRRGETAVKKNRTEIIINDPKTSAGKRTIPLPLFIVDLLKQHIDDREKIVDVMKSQWGKKDGEVWVDHGYVLISRIGSAPDRSNMSYLLTRLSKEAEIKHIGLHSLRHTFATRCLENGFDIRTLADIMGHTDVKMTLNTYAHSMSDQKKTNMEKLSDFYNRNPDKND